MQPFRVTGKQWVRRCGNNVYEKCDSHSFSILEVNRRDFRAWYGLGQAYDIIKMHFYSLYYYKTAQQLRPYDSRMLVALGETYDRLDKRANAIKCFQKACNVGDQEGIAVLRLANLYEKMEDRENAVLAYKNFCNDERSVNERSSLCAAYLYLSNHYKREEVFEEATHYAYKCLELDEAKPEAKAILKQIAIEREKQMQNDVCDDMNEITMDVESKDEDDSLAVNQSETIETETIDDLDMSIIDES